MRRRVLIAAQTAKDAALVASDLSIRHWAFLSSERQLLGLRGPIVIVEEYAHRHDEWPLIEEQLERREAQQLPYSLDAYRSIRRRR